MLFVDERLRKVQWSSQLNPEGMVGYTLYQNNHQYLLFKQHWQETTAVG